MKESISRGFWSAEGLESQFAFIAAEPGLGRRTIFWKRPTGPEPRLGDLGGLPGQSEAGRPGRDTTTARLGGKAGAKTNNRKIVTKS